MSDAYRQFQWKERGKENIERDRRDTERKRN